MELFLEHLQQSIVLVPREQLRFTSHGRAFGVPRYLKAMASDIPVAPQTWDYSKGRAVKFPILGNNRYGDCFYAMCAHAAQAWTFFSTGAQCQFDESRLVQRYLQIAGGDNGLSDQIMLPEFHRGIIGPNGPRRTLDEMTVDPNNLSACNLAGWAFGGLGYTCSLLNTWTANPRPGQLWTNDGRPNPLSGHAMLLSGRDSQGRWTDETWGFDPPIYLTHQGLLASDPELIVFFSLDHFNTNGICVFTGMTYEQKAALWVQCGGKPLPPSPFGPVNPPVPPTPVPVPPIPQPPGPQPMPTPPLPPIPPLPNIDPAVWQMLLSLIQWFLSLLQKKGSAAGLEAVGGWFGQLLTYITWIVQTFGPTALPFVEGMVNQLPLSDAQKQAIVTLLESLIGKQATVNFKMNIGL